MLPTIVLIVGGFLAFTGCDEAGMVKPVVPVDGGTPSEPVDPTEPVEPEPEPEPEPTEPSEPIEPEPTEPVEPTEPTEPEPEPTITIAAVMWGVDGSVTVNGTSTDIPDGTTVIVTLGDTVTVTSIVDNTGTWIVLASAADMAALAAGTVTVTATAQDATDTSSFVVPLSEEEQLREEYRQQFEQYNFSEETVERLVNRQVEKKRLSDARISGEISREEHFKNLDRLYEEAYGISYDYAATLRDIYVEERPEEEYLLGGTDADSVGIAYLIVKEANPDAEGEAFEALFRQAAREGTISIAPLDI